MWEYDNVQPTAKLRQNETRHQITSEHQPHCLRNTQLYVSKRLGRKITAEKYNYLASAHFILAFRENGTNSVR